MFDTCNFERNGKDLNTTDKQKVQESKGWSYDAIEIVRAKDHPTGRFVIARQVSTDKRTILKY